MMVYLSLGSNKNDRLSHIYQALFYIEHQIGRIIKKSTIFRSESWGYIDFEYLNICILIDTLHDPENLILLTEKIEKQIGRSLKTGTEMNADNQYKAREIDIDILFYNGFIINKDHLKIPHPKISDRMFVLKPLDQIAPNLEHPLLKKTIHTLFLNCTDQSYVEKYEGEITPI